MLKAITLFSTVTALSPLTTCVIVQPLRVVLCNHTNQSVAVRLRYPERVAMADTAYLGYRRHLALGARYAPTVLIANWKALDSLNARLPVAISDTATTLVIPPRATVLLLQNAYLFPALGSILFLRKEDAPERVISERELMAHRKLRGLVWYDI